MAYRPRLSGATPGLACTPKETRSCFFSDLGSPTFSIPVNERFTGVSSTIAITMTTSVAVPVGGKVVIEVLKSDVAVAATKGFSNIAAPVVGGTDAASFISPASVTSTTDKYTVTLTTKAAGLSAKLYTFTLNGFTTRRTVGGSGAIASFKTTNAAGSPIQIAQTLPASQPVAAATAEALMRLGERRASTRRRTRALW